MPQNMVFSSNNQGNGFDNRLESVNNKKNSTNFEDKPGLVIRVNSEKTIRTRGIGQFKEMEIIPIQNLLLIK